MGEHGRQKAMALGGGTVPLKRPGGWGCLGETNGRSWFGIG